MSRPKSSTGAKPLVLFASNNADSLEYLSEIERTFSLKCTLLELDARSSKDPEAERERSQKCLDSLKIEIKVCMFS